MPIPSHSTRSPVAGLPRNGPTLVPLLVNRRMTWSPWDIASWIVRWMPANAVVAALNDPLNAARPW
jgi:hypothetical protein